MTLSFETKKILFVMLASLVLFFGLGFYLLLLWDGPFPGGTPDAAVYARHTTETLITEEISASGIPNRQFTITRLFPFLFLEGTVLTIANQLPVLTNYWILQHLMNLIFAGLLMILGRRLTKSFLGGVIAAFASFFFTDIPIFFDTGPSRFLSGLSYSSLFFFAILAFFPRDEGEKGWKDYLFFFILGSSLLFSHPHFGVLRFGFLIILMLLAMVIWKKRAIRVLRLPAQSFALVLLFWLLTNLAYFSDISQTIEWFFFTYLI